MSLSLGNDGPADQQPRVPRGRQRGEGGGRARLLGKQHALERLAEPAGVEDIELTFPPHVHARYGEFEAQVGISTGDVLNGYLPRRAAGLVREWVGLHRDELDGNWSRARAGEPLSSIEPLP